MTILSSEVTAEILMQPNVVSIAANASIKEAISMLTEHHVSGLPVLEHNRCVGIISMSDIVEFVNNDSDVERDAADVSRNWLNPETGQWEDFFVAQFHIDQYENSFVSEAMTTELVSVRPNAFAREVATLMQDNQIHRVVVLDDEQKLCGMISAFDFVRAVAN